MTALNIREVSMKQVFMSGIILYAHQSHQRMSLNGSSA